MTQRSQDRQHTGKRGAAQRKARREGYAYRDQLDITECPAALVERCMLSHLMGWGNHRKSAALRGARDWERKHRKALASGGAAGGAYPTGPGARVVAAAGGSGGPA